MRLLIEAGADFNRLSEDEHNGKIWLFIRPPFRKYVVDAFEGDPIMQTLALGKTSRVKDLLANLYYGDIPEEAHESTKSRLNTIFLTAVAQGNSEIVQFMLEHFRTIFQWGRGSSWRHEEAEGACES